MPRLILDCDTKNEIDDQLAIVYALGSANAQVEGIVNVQNVNVNGPDSVRIYQEEAGAILDALARDDVPNLRGVSAPLPDARTPGDAEGVDFIIERARAEADEPLYVVGTGPATDLASAILKAPDIAERARFVWLGGARDAEELARHGGKECNHVGDPFAVKALFESTAPLTHIPAYGVTEKLVWPTDWLVETFRMLGRPIHLLLADRIEAYTKGWTDEQKQRKPFWDIGAVAAVLHPNWCGIIERPAFGLDENAEWVIPGEGTRTINFVIHIDARAILNDAMYLLKRL